MKPSPSLDCSRERGISKRKCLLAYSLGTSRECVCVCSMPKDPDVFLAFGGAGEGQTTAIAQGMTACAIVTAASCTLFRLAFCLVFIFFRVNQRPQGAMCSDRQDIIGIATTGSGKTVAFLFPAFKCLGIEHRGPDYGRWATKQRFSELQD